MLLGSWVQAENPKSIMDIGTGSGLIAFMMAQKFPHALVSGIELDNPSFIQATENSKNSPFTDRMQILQGNFLQYTFTEKFDLIVSNPPFYQGNTSTGKDERDRARHEEHLPQSAFLAKAVQLLKPEGKLAVVLPKEEGAEFVDEAQNHQLYVSRLTRVFGSPEAPEKRWLLEFSFKQTTIIEDRLTIRDTDGQRSEAYKNLTKDFYL